jgi:acyl carrier protein
VSTIVSSLRAYVSENFLYMRPDYVLRDDDSLLVRGIIDSIGVMELVQFVQQEFGVDVDDEEITEANFGSIAAVARFVGERRSLAA